MNDDQTPTRVIFRTYRSDKSVLAILLDMPANRGNVVCYQHLGQHSEGSYFRMMGDTRPATPEEYAPLKRELESAPYRYVFLLRKRRSIQDRSGGDGRKRYQVRR